jgi:hypothetical protein
VTLIELVPGMEVTWLNVPRGGYGFAMPVDAIVMRVCARLVRIEVSLRDGQRVERLVHPNSLRPKP